MKILSTLFVLCLLSYSSFAQTHTFHEYSALNMAGDTVSMSQYYGKKVMVVNCASFCSYTPQYTPLQQLYTQYQSYGFEIIGFPSDDFFNQGGTDSQIINTCHDYGVTFPIMDKIHVATGSIAPVFQWLEQSSLNGVSNATVTWNFNKFLVDEAGHWVRHYTQNTDPMDTAIINWILSPSVVSSAPSLSMDEQIELKSTNPASSQIELVVKSTEPQRYNIGLYAADGKLVNTIFEGTAANQNITYSVSSLPSGIYFIKIQSGERQKSIRYAVVR
jgi:glutathione peroxidase